MNKSKWDRVSEVVVYTSGLVACSVCAPKDMSIEDVTRLVNLQNPTGISSQWKLSEDEYFAVGEPHPMPCNEDDTKVHYLFEC